MKHQYEKSAELTVAFEERWAPKDPKDTQEWRHELLEIIETVRNETKALTDGDQEGEERRA